MACWRLPPNPYLSDNPTFFVVFSERSSCSIIIHLCSHFLHTSNNIYQPKCFSETILSGSQVKNNRWVLNSTVNSPKISLIPTMWKALLGTQKLVRHNFHLLELTIKWTDTHKQFHYKADYVSSKKLPTRYRQSAMRDEFN